MKLVLGGSIWGWGRLGFYVVFNWLTRITGWPLSEARWWIRRITESNAIGHHLCFSFSEGTSSFSRGIHFLSSLFKDDSLSAKTEFLINPLTKHQDRKCSYLFFSFSLLIKILLIFTIPEIPVWRATKQRKPSPYLATSRLQQLSIFHSFGNFWENTDFACDRNRELLISQHNWKTRKRK